MSLPLLWTMSSAQLLPWVSLGWKGPALCHHSPGHVPARQWTRAMAQKGKLRLHGWSWALFPKSGFCFPAFPITELHEHSALLPEAARLPPIPQSCSQASFSSVTSPGCWLLTPPLPCGSALCGERRSERSLGIFIMREKHELSPNTFSL